MQMGDHLQWDPVLKLMERSPIHHHLEGRGKVRVGTYDLGKVETGSRQQGAFRHGVKKS